VVVSLTFGLIKVIVVELDETICAAAVPKYTVRELFNERGKFVPVNVTVIPPFTPPIVGVMLVNVIG
jgi:hypothetical protein